ncbi:RNA polymerase factor sigma-54 [uncultured Fusobacterium sp.]|uniref:RNA polymerase factor sigma-54 n=1 Tax=uncultured Fusobacterium sp. TaxID=159267 RepID=UPI0025E98C0F|nr:RNA polymerase factor sigma-54 [uncultured Fusobacterium sp.]
MDFSLKLKQETKLILTQEMKVSMNILQMSSSKLKEYLEQEATTNPAIEINYINTPTYKSSSEDNTSPLDFVSKEETLIDFLIEQLSYLKLSTKIKNICFFIINNLDSRGYLAISKIEIKKLLNISTLQLNEAFKIIHTLDPIGIGAENLKDCLKIQLKFKGIDDSKLFLLIDQYLEEIANQNFELISKELKISKEQILEYLNLIRTLSPIPARGYLVDTDSNYIVPEARIEIKNNKLIFTINENAIPKININTSYINSENANQKSIYTAINIMKCLEKRYQTLTKILELLLIKQKEFFFKGEKYLKTLTLKDLAKELSLHESTISRAIKDKYLDTPQGIISMKSLFIIDSKSIEIKNIIIELINSENKKAPLSDEKISLFLKNKGFEIARRTVAKYREELGFPSTRDRKK